MPLHLSVHVFMFHALNSPNDALSTLVEAVLKSFSLTDEVIGNGTALDVAILIRNAAIFELLFDSIKILVLDLICFILPAVN